MTSKALPPLQSTKGRPAYAKQYAAQVQERHALPARSDEEHRKAAQAFVKQGEDEGYHTTSYVTNRFLYWCGLLFLLAMNFAIAVILLPLLLLLHGIAVNMIVLAIGLTFGLVFDYLVRDIEHLDRRHHLFAGLFIPLVALLDLFVIQAIAARMAQVLELTISQNPLLSASLYILGFLAPFTYSYLVDREFD